MLSSKCYSLLRNWEHLVHEGTASAAPLNLPLSFEMPTPRGAAWMFGSPVFSAVPCLRQSIHLPSRGWVREDSLHLSAALSQSKASVKAASGLRSTCLWMGSWGRTIRLCILGSTSPSRVFVLLPGKEGDRYGSSFKCHRFWQSLPSFGRFTWINMYLLAIKTTLAFSKTLQSCFKTVFTSVAGSGPVEFLMLSCQTWNFPSSCFMFVIQKSKHSHSLLPSLSYLLMGNIFCSMPALFFSASVKMWGRRYCELWFILHTHMSLHL